MSCSTTSKPVLSKLHSFEHFYSHNLLLNYGVFATIYIPVKPIWCCGRLDKTKPLSLELRLPVFYLISTHSLMNSPLRTVQSKVGSIRLTCLSNRHLFPIIAFPIVFSWCVDIEILNKT